jgi:hypothetical protein
MNTIPTTHNDRTPPYTVVGGSNGRAFPDSLPISVILLDRGSRLYRGDVFRELDRIGFDSIVSVEEGVDSMDVESLAGRYPKVRFLLLSAPTTAGEKVNLGIRESCGRFALVLWSDMRLLTQAISSRFFERLTEQNLLCQVPFLTTRGGEAVPTAAVPAFDRSSLKVLNLTSTKDGERSLYPFDFCGIYSREKFVLTGGYDGGLANPYWQKLDFGFRAWLWGEEIRFAQALKAGYAEAAPEEDSTPDEHYKWFWLKNLAPRFKGDSALIPVSRFWSYLRSRGRGIFDAMAEFKAAREWVRINRYRFRSGATSLVDLWEEPGT